MLQRVFVALVLITITVTTAATPPENLTEVVIVFKTHYDLGYTDLASKVIDQYRSVMMDKALAVCDANRTLPPDERFVWTVPGWPMAEMLKGGAGSERPGRVMQALRDGYFAVHALPFTTHTESLELEDLVRGMHFSSEIARTCGQELPRDAKMTDVPSHSWVLPTLLRHAGVELMHIGCNAASACPEVPPLFWWEGPDGSRVLTRYDKEYGSSLVPPKDWPYPVWLALLHTGDNHGPPSPEDIEKLLDQARRELPGVKVHVGHLADFADALLITKPEIPVIRGDMPDTWIHGIMSMPFETAKVRNLRPAIVALEQADILCSLAGVPREDNAQRIAEAYEHSLLFGEHTWGMDAKQFPRAYGTDWQTRLAAGEHKKLTDSWIEKGQHALALDTIGQTVTSRTAALADAFGGWVVYNPLPWPREFAGTTVPGGGFRVLDTAPNAKAGDDLEIDEAAGTIQNRFFRIVVEPESGGLRSWLDKRTGRELLAQQDGPAMGNYLYERFSQADFERYVSAYARNKATWVFGDFGKPGLAADKAHEDFHLSNATVRFERMLGLIRAIVSGRCGPDASQKVTLGITLRSETPSVDMSCSIDAQPDSWPSAAWLSLAFALEQPRFLLGRLGGLVDPSSDVIKGANHDVYCLNTGLVVVGKDGTAVGICPIDSPVVSLERPGLLHYTPDFQPTQAKVFVNLHNNVWGTNFAQWCEPFPSEWRVRLWVADQDNIPEDLARNAWEARVPLVTAESKKPCARTFARHGVVLSKPGTLLTAFGPNPDGEGIVLRLWEQTGKSGDCVVTLPEGFHADSAQPCDLRGRANGPAIAVNDGCFTAALQGNAPSSFLLPMP